MTRVMIGIGALSQASYQPRYEAVSRASHGVAAAARSCVGRSLNCSPYLVGPPNSQLAQNDSAMRDQDLAAFQDHLCC